MQRKEKGKAEEKSPEGYLHSLITPHWIPALSNLPGASQGTVCDFVESEKSSAER